jgi:hypothetical protein
MELLRLDEDTCVVDFKKISGAAFEFHEKTQAIKNLIQAL